MDQHGIIIVGGGPVGLALALMLARREVSSTVIDARELEVARSDQRLLALARGTVDLLRPLLDLPQEACAPIRTVVVSSAGEFGRVVIREDDLGIGPLGVTVRYGALVVPLAQACERCQRVSVLRPRRVMSLEQQPARVRLTLDDGSTVDAALAVNAEGTMVLTGQQPRQTGIVADVVVAGPAAGEAHERFTREGPLALLPTPAAAASDGRTLGMVWCMTLGVGAGQMSRIDSARIATIKAKEAGLSLAGCGAASDAFFPFRDGLDVVVDAGASCVIQPGGSVRDDEVIAAADERGVTMVFTGTRHFRH